MGLEDPTHNGLLTSAVNIIPLDIVTAPTTAVMRGAREEFAGLFSNNQRSPLHQTLRAVI